MDNVTHSLAGLLVAASAVRLRARRDGAEPTARFRRVAAISSMVAANLPDADLLYTGTGDRRLAYMLYHRGYTHTVIMAIVAAILVWGVATLALRWPRLARATPQGPETDANSGSGMRPTGDARWLLALLLVSSLSHLALDWTNSYGVHLFWPFDDRWSYGDAVFIVEPWFWVVTVPMLVASTRSWIARVLLSLILLAGLVLAWRTDIVATGAATALTLGAALSIVLARVLRPGPRAATAVAGWITVTLMMVAGSRIARQATLRAARGVAPSALIADVVVTPLPANAVCMSVISVEREAATYRVATARVSAAPSITPASRCGMRGGSGPTFRPSTRASTSSVHWDSEWTAPAIELASLARESCVTLAALRFIRVPMWREISDSSLILGDARFGGASGSGFSDVTVTRRSTSCPSAPPWTPPRADLLGL